MKHFVVRLYLPKNQKNIVRLVMLYFFYHVIIGTRLKGRTQKLMSRILVPFNSGKISFFFMTLHANSFI